MVVRFRLSDAIPETRSAFPFKARWYTPAVGPSCLRTLANHACHRCRAISARPVLLGSMLEKVHTCDVALRPIALSEIDQTRAFRAEDVHPKAQSFCLFIFVHC